MNTPATTENRGAINPFGGTNIAQASGNALIETESQRAIQEVQAAMTIAKKFPRDSIEAMERILNACTRPTLAETALYSYPRGGQEVTGPSIRLAETVAQEWGNMQFGIRELSQFNGESTVEAFAWDVQTNTRQVKVFQVPHIRHTRQGQKRLSDPRDIYEMVANQGARRLRACILGVIPGDVIEAAVNQCHVTQSANVDTSAEALKKFLEYFSKFNVTQEMIEERLGMRWESVRPAQILQLKKIYQSLRDGMSKPDDWFAMPLQEDKPETGSVQSMLKPDSKNKSSKPNAQPEPEPAPTDSEAYKKLEQLIGIAKSLDDLDELLVMQEWDTLNDSQGETLQALVQIKREEINS